MKWIEKVFRPDAKFARKIKRYKFWLGQFSQILGWPRWRNLTRTPTIKCWVTRELYSAIPKFFSEKVDFQTSMEGPTMLLKQFVCMAAIDQLKFPIFQRKYKKLQIATSTVGPISNWIFEMIDLWPWVEASIESILLPVFFWENGSDGEPAWLRYEIEKELPAHHPTHSLRKRLAGE